MIEHIYYLHDPDYQPQLDNQPVDGRLCPYEHCQEESIKRQDERYLVHGMVSTNKAFTIMHVEVK